MASCAALCGCANLCVRARVCRLCIKAPISSIALAAGLQLRNGVGARHCGVPDPQVAAFARCAGECAALGHGRDRQSHPEDEITVSLVQRDCSYLQALEGEIDTSHFGFLHGGHVEAHQVTEDEPLYHTVTNRAPQYHVADTPWGTQYAGYRSAGPGRTYWRFANFLFPCWIQAPNGEFDSHAHGRAWVPIDDHHTL